MLRKFHIAQSKNTPEVIIDPETSYVLIKGNSVSENSFGFYKPVLDTLDQYQDAGIRITKIDVNMDYFNSSSSKIILDILLRIKKRNEKIEINWYVKKNDPDMMEAAEDYMAIVNVPFHIHEK